MGIDGAEIKRRRIKEELKKRKDEEKPTPPKNTAKKSAFNRTSIAKGVLPLVPGLILGGLMLFIIYGPATEKPKALPKKTISTTKKVETAVDNALKKTKLNYTWATAAGGKILKLDLKITNNFAYQIKDVKIFCIYAGASGTILGTTSKTLYEAIPPNVEMNFGSVNMGFIHGQTSVVRCDPSKLVIDYSKSINN